LIWDTQCLSLPAKKGIPDGIYGWEMRATVIDFQTKQSLGKDGIVGKDIASARDDDENEHPGT